MREEDVKVLLEVTTIMTPDTSPITVLPFAGLLHRAPRSQPF